MQKLINMSVFIFWGSVILKSKHAKCLIIILNIAVINQNDSLSWRQANECKAITMQCMLLLLVNVRRAADPPNSTAFVRESKQVY